jgi:hypothetical protein
VKSHAAKVKSADRAIRKLEAARKSLRAELAVAADSIDMSLARACDALTVAIQSIEYERRRTVDLIAEIKEWDQAHALNSAR